MPDYVNVDTQQRHSLAAIRRAHPNQSIPESGDLSALGYAPIEPVKKPSPGVNGVIAKGDPEEYEPGKWRETWVISNQPIDVVLAEKQQQRIAALETAREAGFTHNGNIVASDPKSQTLLGSLNTEAALALMSGDQTQLDAFAAGLGDGWRAIDGTIVATNAAEFRAMMHSWYVHIATTDAIAQQHKAAIKAAIDAGATIDELNAIDVTAGYAGVTP